MLNAYKGIFSDFYPVAPEFWYYYPAKVLGVDMIEFEREIPFWYALQTTFKKYNTEGWGNASVQAVNDDVKANSKLVKVSDSIYRLTENTLYKGHEFTTTRLYDKKEPSWSEKTPVENEDELSLHIDMQLSENVHFVFDGANEGHKNVGEDYLLELFLGVPFFDFIAGSMGYENAVMYFMSGNDDILKGFFNKYAKHTLRMLNEAVKHTDFESYSIGCSFSCNSLIGPELWRKWDKPFIKLIADEVHRLGKLLHIHFHGKSMETVEDFNEIGIDCICPFERPLGGDVDGLSGLRELRSRLSDKITVNGNVHTVETLIRGTTSDVRREVRELKDAFSDSPRLIIGTGDQVGLETPEENIYAMVDEARKK